MTFTIQGGPGVVGIASLSNGSAAPVLQGATTPVNFTISNTANSGADTIVWNVNGAATAGSITTTATGSGLVAGGPGQNSSVTYAAPAVGTNNYGWQTVTLTASGGGATGVATVSPANLPVSVDVIGVASANGANFGTAITTPVSAGGSYGGLGTAIGNGNGSILNSNAMILAGVNGASSTTISMAWRNRTATEVAGSPGPQLVSDVVQLTGISPTTTPYVLQMSFDPTLVGPNGASSVPSAASNGFIYLVSQNAHNQWVNAASLDQGSVAARPRITRAVGHSSPPAVLAMVIRSATSWVAGVSIP